MGDSVEETTVLNRANFLIANWLTMPGYGMGIQDVTIKATKKAERW